MILAYAICNVSVAPVRKEPYHTSEQVNQVLFGERAEILEINDRDWAKIRTEWDGYEGWCKLNQFPEVSKKEYSKDCRFWAGSHSDKLLLDDSQMWLPLGAELRSIKGEKNNILREKVKFKGKKLETARLELTPENIIAAAMHYIHAPYQWGGRTLAGLDCSGLSQMAFKLCGKAIPRDASQQASEGETVDFLQHANCGDLAFFNNADGNINHVGILLDNHTIIHSTDTSGRVVIDKIDQGGIISKRLRKRTHSLRLVKRYID